MNVSMPALQLPSVSRRAVLGGSLALAAAAGLTWADPQPARAESNLLLNPGFEEVVDGRPAHWRPFNAASATRAVPSGDRVRSGNYALKLGDGATPSIGLRSAAVSVTAGQVYRASAHTFVESGSQFALYLEFWNAAGARISTVVKSYGLAGIWHMVDAQGVAPEGAVTASLLLYAPTTSRGVAWFDDCSLAAASEAQVERFGPATLTAAVRGAAIIGDRLYMSARYAVSGTLFRLGEFDLNTGELIALHDLELGGPAGQKLTTDGRYVYIGPAGSAYIWRFDPATGDVEAWVEIGPATTWTYSMQVREGYLYLGTYPDATIRRINLATGAVDTYGRVSTSLYATGVAVDDDYVFGGSAAPGKLLRWNREGGGAPLDLTAHLSDSPVGILHMIKAGDRLYVASGRQVISILPDGSGRYEHSIPAEDRYVDHLAVGPDGAVYALARLTTNLYRVTEEGLTKIAQPFDNVENIHLEVFDDGRIVGVTGLGHFWVYSPGGETKLWDSATLGFGYPDKVQSMILTRSQRVWVAGHYAITIHHPKSGEQRRIHVNGEAKALAEDRDGVVYAALYPSATIVAVNPGTYEVSVVGAIGNGQMRTMDMVYDKRRHQLVVATGPTGGNHQGAVTFVDLATGEFDVRKDYLPEQRVMSISIEGSVAYVVGDTWGESTQGPILPAGQVAAVDLTTRELLWRKAIRPDWASYEQVEAVDGVLYLVSRRPRGNWIAYEVATGKTLHAGDLGGYGGLDSVDGRVFSWVHWALEIRQLPSKVMPEAQLLYSNVPMGWYNNPMFAFTPNGKATWGVWGTDLVRIPLPKK